MDYKQLRKGDKIWLVTWHGHNSIIGEVERVTPTQVVVVFDYSFQGGTNRSVQKFRRTNSERGYGAGQQIGGGMCPDHLGEQPTAVERNVFKRECDTKHRARMSYAQQAREQEATRERLNALLPDGVYVELNRDQDEFSVHISALQNETDVIEIANVLHAWRALRPKQVTRG